MPWDYNRGFSQKRPRVEEVFEVRASKSRSLPSTRSESSRPDIRTVSFNANPLPGAAAIPPGHRSASPSRPAMRSVTPQVESPANSSFATTPNNESEDFSVESICEQLHDLRAQIVHFASVFRPCAINQRSGNVLEALLKPLANKETVAFASLLVLGALQSLIVGMVTRTLREQVFDCPYFAPSKAEKERISAFEKESASSHSFVRQQEGRRLFQDIATKVDSKSEAALLSMAGKITTQLYKLISPLYDLGGRDLYQTSVASSLAYPLFDIVCNAAQCARKMKVYPNVVWEWTDAVKDFEFDPKVAECFNVGEMLQTSPYARSGESGRVMLKPGQERRAQSIIVGIVSPGLVGYSRGQDDDAFRDADKAPKSHMQRLEQSGASAGFRRRVVMKNVVLLRWGMQRLKTQTLGRPEEFRRRVANGEGDSGAVALWDLFVERHAGKT